MPGSLATPCTNVRWMIVFMLAVMVGLAHFNRVSISVAGSERFIKDGLIDKVAMGQIYTAFLLVYTACMLPAGWLIDRIGPTNALTGMGLGMGACVAMTGVAGWQANSLVGLWGTLLLVRGIAGAASAPLHPAAARCVSLWHPAVSRIRANGFVTAGALLGIAVSYPVFGWLMDRFDWPAAFVICGVAMMIFTAGWRFVATDHAAVHRWTNDAEQTLVAQAELRSEARQRPSLRHIVRLFMRRDLVLLSISYGTLGYFQYLFFYWIEHYFDETLHLPPESSRWATFQVTLAMAVGMAVGGWIADWLCGRLGDYIGRRTIAISGMLLSAVLAVVGVQLTEPDYVVACFSLSMALLGTCEGVFWTSVTDIGGRSGGLAAAFLNTFGNGIGAIAPWLTPVLIKRYESWTVAIGVACAVVGFGGALWLWIDPGRRSDADATVG